MLLWKGKNILYVYLIGCCRYHAIFYTGGHLANDYILRKHLLPHGSFVSTMPEYLTSDSLGFVFGNIFAGCVRIKLLLQVCLII